MATTADKLRDWWEVKTPRERRLVMVLAAVLAFAIVAAIVLSIQRGLTRLEEGNALKRDALDSVRIYQSSAIKRNLSTSTVAFSETAVDLDTYINNIFKEMSLTSPTYPSPKTTEKGAYTEVAMDIKITQELTVLQMAELLEKIETKDRKVFVKNLEIRNRRGTEDKLNMSMTVITFKKNKKPVAEGES